MIDEFEKIPRFTREATYKVNQSWTYLERWIENQVEDGLQLDPDFQRLHVWTEAQQIAYVEYALRGGRSGRELFFNCNGWRRGERDFETFVLVDGKQRLNAVRRFMASEIPAFGTRYKDFKDHLGALDVDFIVNVNELKTKKEILTWYIEMNSGGTPHTEEEIEKARRLLKENE